MLQFLLHLDRGLISTPFSNPYGSHDPRWWLVADAAHSRPPVHRPMIPSSLAWSASPCAFQFFRSQRGQRARPSVCRSVIRRSPRSVRLLRLARSSLSSPLSSAISTGEICEGTNQGARTLVKSALAVEKGARERSLVQSIQLALSVVNDPARLGKPKRTRGA